MATLQVIKGPNAGDCYDLGSAESVLGRYPFCEVVLPSHTVSRQHARIVRVGEQFFVEDLGSLNGTFLNGDRVRRRTAVKDQDRIRLYDILLLFHSCARAAVPPLSHLNRPAVGTEPSEPEAEEALRPLATVSALELRPAGGEKPEVREKHRTALALGRRWLAEENLGKLMPALLDGIFELFPQCERGHILFATGSEGGSLVPIAVRQPEDEAEASRTLGPASDALARRVMAQGEAVLSGEGEAESGSVLETGQPWTMCAPLLGPSRTGLGVIHVETTDSQQAFSEDDLRVLLGAALVAGQAIELAQLNSPAAANRDQHVPEQP